MKKIVVLISGRGSNLKSLIASAKDYEVCAVISDRPEAPGLQYARDAGIPVFAASQRETGSKAAMKARIFELTKAAAPDFVVLAGYMQIVQPEFVRHFDNRIINIHPSLLPEYAGLDTHERALHDGVKIHGCTVHLVDEGLDTGAIIAQAQCPVEPGDTPETLAARLLTFEHRLYPWVINALARGEILTSDAIPEVTPAALKNAAREGFIIP